MPRLLLVAGDPVDAAEAASAWAAGRPGAAWLDVAGLADRLTPAPAGGAAFDPPPADAAVAAVCAAAVELVAAGLDVAVAGGPADTAAYEARWRPRMGAVDHRVVAVGDVGHGGWPDDAVVPAGDPDALSAQLGVPGSGWRDEVLEDGDLRLRPPAAADVPALVAACRDPEIPRWTTVPSPYEEQHAVEFVRRAADGRRRGTALDFLVVDRATDRLVGCASLIALNWPLLTATAGYWVAAEARGMGVARRSLGIVARFAFDRLGLRRVQLDVMPANAASCRVAEAAGFRREGVRRSAFPRGDGRVDVVGYGLVPEHLEEATVG
jgi:RimJ/RimL family protein N-acetyltransferase